MNKYKKKILGLYKPTLISYLTFTLVMMIDAMFIGNLFGEAGQSAVTLITPLMLIENAIVFSFIIGMNTFVAHAVGVGDDKEVNEVFNQTLIFGTICVFIISFILALLLTPYLHIFTENNLVIHYGFTYGIIMLAFNVLNFVVLIYFFLQRVIGNPKIMTHISIISLILNIIFNSLFVLVFNLDIAGIALASFVTLIFQFIYMQYVVKKQNDDRLKLCYYKIDIKLLRSIFFNGLSDGLYDLSQSIMMLLYTIILFVIIGEKGYSYLYVFSQVLLIQFVIFFALADSINPLIAQSYGNKNFKDIKEYKKSIIEISIVLSIFVYLVFMIIKIPIFKIYGVTDDSIAYIVKYSYIYFAVILIWPLNQIFISYYTALKKTKVALIIATVKGIVLISIITILLTYLFGDAGLWSSYFVSEVLVLLGIIIYDRKIKLK